MLEPSQETQIAEETYVEWIKRATAISEMHLKTSGVEDWVSGQMQRKYRLAGHLSRRIDGRWSIQMFDWETKERWGGQKGVGEIASYRLLS